MPKGTVYFIQSQSGPIKIGWTRGKPHHRISAIQQATPEKLTLLKTITGGRAEEKRWHDKFADLRVQGEWFRADPRLLGAIDKATEGVDVDPEAKTEVIQLRVHGWEKEQLFDEAEREGITVATLLRRALGLEEGNAKPKPVKLPPPSLNAELDEDGSVRMDRDAQLRHLVAKHKPFMSTRRAEAKARQELAA